MLEAEPAIAERVQQRVLFRALSIILAEPYIEVIEVALRSAPFCDDLDAQSKSSESARTRDPRPFIQRHILVTHTCKCSLARIPLDKASSSC